MSEHPESTASTDGAKPITGKRYRVEYDREGCIGAAACYAVYKERWVVVDDGNADLIGADRDAQNIKHTLIIGEDELAKMKESAESCPVSVIHIIDEETGERLI